MANEPALTRILLDVQLQSNAQQYLDKIDELSNEQLMAMCRILCKGARGKSALLQYINEYYAPELKYVAKLLMVQDVDKSSLYNLMFNKIGQEIYQHIQEALQEDASPKREILAVISASLLEPFENGNSLLQIFAKYFPFVVPNLLYILHCIKHSVSELSHEVFIKLNSEKGTVINYVLYQLPDDFYDVNKPNEIKQIFAKIVLDGLLIKLDPKGCKEKTVGEFLAIKTTGTRWSLGIKLIAAHYPEGLAQLRESITKDYPKKLASFYEHIVGGIMPMVATANGQILLRELFLQNLKVSRAADNQLSMHTRYQSLLSCFTDLLILKFLLNMQDNNKINELILILNSSNEANEKIDLITQIVPPNLSKLVWFLLGRSIGPMRMIDVLYNAIMLYRQMPCDAAPPVWGLQTFLPWIGYMLNIISITRVKIIAACKELHINLPEIQQFENPYVLLFFLLLQDITRENKYILVERLYDSFLITKQEICAAKGGYFIGLISRALINSDKTIGYEAELINIIYKAPTLNAENKLSFICRVWNKASTSLEPEQAQSRILSDLNLHHNILNYLAALANPQEKIADFISILFDLQSPLSQFFRKVCATATRSKQLALSGPMLYVLHHKLQAAGYEYSLEEKEKLAEMGLPARYLAPLAIAHTTSEPIAYSQSYWPKLPAGALNDLPLPIAGNADPIAATSCQPN
jgi:hypothetical protein